MPSGSVSYTHLDVYKRQELIRGARVICVPGTAFGAMGEGYLRLVFANSDDNLKEAVRRIDAYIRKAYPDMK